MELKPNLTALLGLVAVAGWQNRDKISDFVKGMSTGGATSPAAAIPGGLGGALGGLINHMQNNGAGDIANSWVGTGSNMPINNSQLGQVLGGGTLAKLAAATGLSQEQLLAQLSQVLPQVVDKLTPTGQLPRG